MKKMRLLMAFFTLLLTYSASAVAIEKIRFATEGTYPPFEYIDESGELKGFDIDIAKALCQQIKAECTFSNQTFSSLIPSLKLGKYDALIASIGITDERKKQVAFTDSYYEPSANYVAPLAKHYTLADFPGKTFGVQQGTTFEKYLQDKYGSKITIKTYGSVQDAFLDLASGRVDIVLTDTPIAQAWLKQDANSQKFGYVDKPIIDHDYFGAGYGIAVRQNDTDLLNALNKALVEIKANGTYNTIAQKYFGK